MPPKQIKEFAAVVTPVSTDRLLTQQTADDVTRMMTVKQVLGITAEGDLIQGGALGVPERLVVGAAGGLLQVLATKAAWLAIGAADDFLAVVGGVPTWTKKMIFPVFGNCRLTKSGANLLLSPYNGNRVVINGKVEIVPSAGVTLAPTGLVAATTYFIYAFMSAGVMTLEASITGHSTDTATGVEIKTADATRSLVGMARVIAGPAFVDTITQRFVISWFNRFPIHGLNVFGANKSTTSLSLVELDSTIRAEFLNWGNSAVFAGIAGGIQHAAVDEQGRTLLSFDGVTNNSEDAVSSDTAHVANRPEPLGGSTAEILVEGYHFLALFGAVSIGTGTWLGGAVPDRTRWFFVIQG